MTGRDRRRRSATDLRRRRPRAKHTRGRTGDPDRARIEASPAASRVVVGGGFAGPVRRAEPRHRSGGPPRRSSTGAISTCSSRCSTRSRPGALSPGDIAQPLRSVLRKQRNTTVILGEAVGLDPDRREVLIADGGPIAYDTLVVATGAHHTYFDHPEWATVAPGLKTIEDALEIRRRILIAFEAAEREADPDRRRAWMTFVLVGGGPTGVELAGALGEIAHDTLKRDFRCDPVRPDPGDPDRGDGSGPAALSARSVGLGAAPAREARRDGPDGDAGRSTSTRTACASSGPTGPRRRSRPGPSSGRRAC